MHVMIMTKGRYADPLDNCIGHLKKIADSGMEPTIYDYSWLNTEVQKELTAIRLGVERISPVYMRLRDLQFIGLDDDFEILYKEFFPMLAQQRDRIQMFEEKCTDASAFLPKGEPKEKLEKIISELDENMDAINDYMNADYEKNTGFSYHSKEK